MKRKRMRRIDFVGPILPPGVFRVAGSTSRSKRPWGARSSHPETGVQTHLGVFATVEEAWEAVRTFTPARRKPVDAQWEHKGALPTGVTRAAGATPDSPSPWEARIWLPLEQRRKYLGRYPTVELAKEAYDKAYKSRWKPTGGQDEEEAK